MRYLIIGCVLIAAGLLAQGASAEVIEAGPDKLSETTSLGRLIAESRDTPVHILFVHGIRAGDRGSSNTFRKNLCQKAGLACPLLPPRDKPLETHPLDIGPRPDISYMGQAVWSEATDEAWTKFGPFVDRYEYRRAAGDGAPVIVDEVNWWPLTLPLRCRALLVPEAQLAGRDEDDLRLCAAIDKKGKPLQDGIHYAWLDKSAFDAAMAPAPRGAGAALANGFVKRALMDWGLSDAVIALGPMKTYLHEVVEQAFGYAADRDRAQRRPVKFVVVAESLGSFIVFDAYAHAQGNGRTTEVLDDTAYVYFFANQLALLELGRLTVSPSPALAKGQRLGLATPAPAPAPDVSLSAALERWGKAPVAANLRKAEIPSFKQIIAFSDPSDALTFRVEKLKKMDGVKVVNVYDRNGIDLGLAADPVAAHTGHSNSNDVLNQMLH